METKICKKCNTPRDIKEFYLRKGLNSVPRSVCKFCELAYQKARKQRPEIKAGNKEYARLYYLKNGHTGSKEELARRTKDSVARKKKWFFDYKKTLSCLKCG